MSITEYREIQFKIDIKRRSVPIINIIHKNIWNKTTVP